MEPSQLPLRDIHLPPSVGWWPPAPGWWLLLALAAALVIAGSWLQHRLRRPNLGKESLRILDRLQHNPTLDDSDRIRQMSTLLRRISISAYPRHESAGLTGEAWLRFLDRALTDNSFSEGPGRVLIEAPYRPNHAGQIDIDALYALCRKWIAAVTRRTR